MLNSNRFPVQFLTATLLLASPALSQVQERWTRVRDSSIHAWDEATDVSLDAAGNAYVVGSANPPTATDAQKAFLVAYDAAGNELWSHIYLQPSNLYSFFNRVVALRNGGAIVLGRTQAFGTDLLLKRFDLAGNELWSTTYGATPNGLDFARSLAVDDARNSYIAGRTSHAPGSPNNLLDVLVVKFDANGVLVWSTVIDGPLHTDEYANAVALDAAGNVYVGGLSVQAAGSANFVAKLAPNGSVLWTREYAPVGQGSHEALEIAVDDSGVYTAGYARPPSATTSNAIAEVTKFGPDGQFAWAQTIAGTQPGLFDAAAHIALDPRGNVTVLGSITNFPMSGLDLFVAQWDASGNARWNLTYDGPNHGDDNYGSLLVDRGGDVFATSSARGPGVNDIDTVVQRFDRDGNSKWTYVYSSAPGSLFDFATNAAALAADGSLQLVGHQQNNGPVFAFDFLSVRLDPDVRAFCFGDGSGSACPCGNASAVGDREGCRNSLGVGAKLVESGVSRLSADSLQLSAFGMPDSSALYFQGTGVVNGGPGAVFGDGLRCAGGTIARLGAKQNIVGASRYPDAGDAPISSIGFVAGPGVRTYQCWYRNDASFCTASSFNLTNGLRVTWEP